MSHQYKKLETFRCAMTRCLYQLFRTLLEAISTCTRGVQNRDGARSPVGLIPHYSKGGRGQVSDTPPLIAFDHLGDQDVAPRTQAWSSPLARAYGIAKGLPNSPVIRNNIILSIQTIIWEVNLCRTGIT
jgi:hypothetical protein